MRMRFLVVTALIAYLGAASAILSNAQSSLPNKPVSASDDLQEAVVMEHYATHASWDADGTGTREITAVIRVQADAGVQELAVLTFSYRSANESLDIDYVRVRKPDGTIIVTPAYNIQDMPGSVTRIAPMYSDVHEKHITVKALGIGDVLEYAVRYHILKSDVPGQFWFEHSFQKDMIVKDEELELSFPRDKYVNISSPDTEPSVQEEGSRRVYRWRAANLKRVEAPLGSQSKRDAPPPSVQVSTFHTWDEVGNWYGRAQAAQVVATPSIQAKAAELMKGLTSDDQKIRALYNFVATRLHYVSLSFGTGRYEPHPADQVLDNGYGDCKDKHTLLAALLKAAGYDAWPALINTTRQITSKVPSPGQFDHVVTVIPRGDSLVWLDTTPEVAPVGLLLANLRDKQALVMPTDKPAKLMKTPPEPPFPSTQTFVAGGKLSPDGTFTGHIEWAARRDAEVLFRIGFRATSPAHWKNLVHLMSLSVGFSGEVAAVTASAPEDTEKPFQFSYDYTRKGYGDWPNRRITLPLPTFGVEGGDDEKAKPTEPVFLGAQGDIVYRSTVELPAGYTVTPPDKLDLITDYAEYHAQYGFEKNILTAVRRFVIKKSEVPLSEWDNYRKFCKALADDRGHWIDLIGLDASAKPAEAGLNSEDVDALTRSASTAIEKHNYSLAADLLNKALKLDPGNKWAWNSQGVVYMGMRRFDDAAAAFRKLIELSPNDLHAYNNLGRVLMIQGQLDEAQQAFQKQILINPREYWSHENLGRLLLSQKKCEEARQEFEAAVAISDKEPAAHAGLGEAYLKLGQVDKAMAAFDTAVQIAPSPSLFNQVAYLLAEKGEHLDKARQFAESAISSLDAQLRDIQLKNLQVQHLNLVNLLGITWDTLGWVYFQQGNVQLAERYLAAAWSLTQHAVVADHLGQLHENQGEKKIAARFYAQGVAASHPPAETLRRLIAVADGEKEADVMVTQARDELSRLRTTTVQIAKPLAHQATAEFFISFLPGPQVDDVKFISGDEQLLTAVPAIAAAKYDIVFPSPEATKIVRRGVLACPEKGSPCEFVLLLPDTVHSVN